MGQYMAAQFHRMIHSCARMPAKWPEEMLVRRGVIFVSIHSRVETETVYEASQDVTTFWWMRGSLGLQVASSADRPLIGRLATNLEVEIPKHINTYPSTKLPTSLLFAQATLELTLSYGNENCFAFAGTP
jgi:hypothetical protein